MAPALATKYVFSLAIQVGTPIVAGDTGLGVRRVIPVLGGEVRGPGMKGVIPFVATDLVRLVILIAFPVLATWLPQRMMAH